MPLTSSIFESYMYKNINNDTHIACGWFYVSQQIQLFLKAWFTQNVCLDTYFPKLVIDVIVVVT